MSEYDLIPELHHIRDEVEAVISANDVEALKAIFVREGLEWEEPVSRFGKDNLGDSHQ